MKKNAIILAAGKSSHFAPFTYEKPKGLFTVKGEVLIERQINQLIDAGIIEIIVVVGYMKEKFFYLEQKYKGIVKLLANNLFSKKGNLLSLYKAKSYLGNTYICCADQYFVENPFRENNEENKSYRICTYMENKFSEFAIDYSEQNVITEFAVGGCNQYAMVGIAYFNESFSKNFILYLDNEINNFGISSMFWEEFYAKHINKLTLYMKEISGGYVYEFDDIDDLRSFDSEFLTNFDSDIVSNICSVLKCNPNDITNISVISAGLTNVSFAFCCNNQKYVYRHPGGTAGNLINRQTELFAQMKAKDIGIDKSVIYMDLSGWKISYFVDNAKNCDFEKNPEQLKISMDYLHKLHNVSPDNTVKIFDNLEEAKKLFSIASSTKGNLQKEFSVEIEKIERLYEYIKLDAERLGYKKVLCHNDVYDPNYLIDSRNEIYLIDWEYAGINYEANDICCILSRYDWSDEQIEKYLLSYFGRNLNSDERRFYYAFIPICAFYWFAWGLYKGSVGDDDGFFFMPSYHNLVRFVDSALASYEVVK